MIIQNVHKQGLEENLCLHSTVTSEFRVKRRDGMLSV